MIEATLCFPLRDRDCSDGHATDSGSKREVLLIEKRRGLGAGWYNGPGGKCEPGEDPRRCAIRETREEVGLEVHALEKAAELTFLLDGEIHTFCHVYRTRSVTGTPTASEEADPEWVPVDEVPYDQMWEDDRLWLPGVLEGRSVTATFRFAGGEPLDEAAFVGHDLDWDATV